MSAINGFEDEYTTRMNNERVKREEERNKKAPKCNETWFNDDGEEEKCVNVQTHYTNGCGAYVCEGCQTHFSVDYEVPSKMRFCWCGWNKQNFSELDCGETWESEDDMFGDY